MNKRAPLPLPALAAKAVAKANALAAAVALPALLAGCALGPGANASLGFVPLSAYGPSIIGEDQAMSAMGDAESSFNNPAAIRGNPVAGAVGVASLDAIAGQVNGIPTYEHIDALYRLELLNARAKVREEAGIDPAAPSQAVIDHLVAYAAALRAGDTAKADAIIATAPFTPGRTAAFLANIPYDPDVARATLRVSTEFLPGGGGTASGLF